MGVLCAGFVPYTAYSIWRELNEAAEVSVTVIADVPQIAALSEPLAAPRLNRGLPAEAPLPAAKLSELAYAEPRVPLNWTSGLFYDRESRRVYLPPGTGRVEIKTDYFYQLHSFTVSGADWDFRREYINDGMVSRIDITGGKVVVRTAAGSLAEYVPNGGEPYVQLINPKEKYNTVIVLDAGHGGHDPGALGPGALYEKDINLNICNKLMEIFEWDNILLLPTRSADVFVSKPDRARCETIRHHPRHGITRIPPATVFLAVSDLIKLLNAKGQRIVFIDL